VQDLGFEVALIRAEAGNEALSPRCPGTRDPGAWRGARIFFKLRERAANARGMRRFAQPESGA